MNEIEHQIKHIIEHIVEKQMKVSLQNTISSKMNATIEIYHKTNKQKQATYYSESRNEHIIKHKISYKLKNKGIASYFRLNKRKGVSGEETIIWGLDLGFFFLINKIPFFSRS